MQWIIFKAAAAFFIFSLQLTNSQAEPIEIADHQEKDKLRVVVFGDFGTGSEDQYKVGYAMAENCKAKVCDFALLVGDNFYSNGVSSTRDKKWKTHFESPYGAFGRFDFWAVLGNHDWDGGLASVNAEIAYTQLSKRWRMPARDYAVPKLPSWVRIYGVDTDKIDPVQIKRASEHLCDKASNWQILFGHHPIYSNGDHGDTREMKNTLEPMIKKCGVDLYLAGHDHHLEHITAQGFETVISGAAAKLRGVDQKTYRPGQNTRQRFARKELGFTVLEVSPDSMEIFFFNEDNRQMYRSRVTPQTLGQPSQNL